MELLRENRPQEAAEFVEMRQTLARAEGDNLWDIYQQADQGAERSQKVRDFLFSPAPPSSSKPLGVGMASAFVGTFAVGTLVQQWGLGKAALIGLGAAVGGGLFAAIAQTFADDGSGGDPTASAMILYNAAGLTGLATMNWVPAAVVAGGTLGALMTVHGVASSSLQRHRAMMSIIDDNHELFAAPPTKQAQLGSLISRAEVEATLARLESEALEQGRYGWAVRQRKDIQLLSTVGGDTFHDMFVATQKRPQERQVLVNWASEILQDAAEREEIRALLGSQAAADQLLVDEDTVQIGDQVLVKTDP